MYGLTYRRGTTLLKESYQRTNDRKGVNMLKTIKVKQEVYDQLEALRRKNETFGECIQRIITAYSQLTALVAEKQEGRG